MGITSARLWTCTFNDQAGRRVFRVLRNERGICDHLPAPARLSLEWGFGEPVLPAFLLAVGTLHLDKPAQLF